MIPKIEARNKQLLSIDGQVFKDLNANGKLDPYEDWRLPVEARVADLLKQMTLPEKAGMLLIQTLNAKAGGRLSDTAIAYLSDEHMTRFIFRNPITAKPMVFEESIMRGADVTPYEAAQFMNLMQELAESNRLGIPLLFKSNARNHYEANARPGINVPAGSFSEWPKEAGLAATRDMTLIAEFAEAVRQEWSAVGIRSIYGYMADLATEPRWYRIHETFTESADLMSEIMTVLVKNLQGETLSADSVALTVKHFPGGGPQEGGGDPHYSFGKNQTYPTHQFEAHLKPFIAAIEAGVSALMPYYGIPVGQDYHPNNVGMAFSKGILTDLLRERLGFKGYINSDTGIIGERAWGLEDKTIDEQIAIAIEAGTDVLSGFNSHEQILELVTSGKLTEERLDQSVSRLLTEQFELGLFENPYVDPNRAAYMVGNRSLQLKAEHAQRKSIVLLQNKQLLPLPKPTEEKPIKLYTMGTDIEVVANEKWGFTVSSGNYDAEAGESRPEIPSDTDYALIRVEVSNVWKRETMFGGPNEQDLNAISFTDMAKAESWIVSPNLDDIQAVMQALGAEKTILAIYFRQPFVLDEASDFLNAGALLATFGVRDAAIMDIISGKFAPTGKLPFALAKDSQAIQRQASDAAGYDEAGTLFAFGHGLSYEL